MRIDNKHAIVAELSKTAIAMEKRSATLNGSNYADMVTDTLCAMFHRLDIQIQKSDFWENVTAGSFSVLPKTLGFMAASDLVFDLRANRALKTLFPREASFLSARKAVIALCDAKRLDIPVTEMFRKTAFDDRMFRFPLSFSGNMDVSCPAGSAPEAVAMAAAPAFFLTEGVADYDHGIVTGMSVDTEDFLSFNRDIMGQRDKVCLKSGLSVTDACDSALLDSLFTGTKDTEATGWGAMLHTGVPDLDLEIFVTPYTPHQWKTGEETDAGKTVVTRLSLYGDAGYHIGVLSMDTDYLEKTLVRLMTLPEDGTVDVDRLNGCVRKLVSDFKAEVVHGETTGDPMPDVTITYRADSPVQARDMIEGCAADLDGSLFETGELRYMEDGKFKTARGRFLVLLDTTGYQTTGSAGMLIPVWNAEPVTDTGPFKGDYDPVPGAVLASDTVRVQGVPVLY